ncbi:hypothetical protein FBU30_009604 [Linnemannia zychae]|nr:hypothetical protein FBU30_009604 [Linnemannia zychae]
MSADEEADIYWQPRTQKIWRKAMKAHYINETLFVHGIYSPYHFSHWLYNGMMPLYSTMKRFGATKNSWLFRAGRFKYDDIRRQGNWEMDHFFYTGREIVLNIEEVSTHFQTLPPVDAPICFKRAVIGLGSQCALNYCVNNIPSEIYQQFRDEIAEHYWQTPKLWEGHVAFQRKAIETKEAAMDVSEAETVSINNEPRKEKNSLKCLDLARYYNFDGVSNDHGLEDKEKAIRVGQRNPDVIDREQDYMDLSESRTNHATTAAPKRKLVVGILQREGSRRLINDNELVETLVKSGFRVKWMTFDHGCGLAETAYLLRDVQVLISPHGNAIGTSLFMPTNDPVPTIISVDTTRYDEGWFKFTTMALAQRFMHAKCGPNDYPDEETKARCPFFYDDNIAHFHAKMSPLILGLPESMVVPDEKWNSLSYEARDELTKSLREYVATHPEAQKLADEELRIMTGALTPESMFNKYGNKVWDFVGNYWKAIPRYMDVPRLIRFLEKRQQDWEQERQQATASFSPSSQEKKNLSPYRFFMDYVRQGKACSGSYCTEIMMRNVANLSTAAFGRHSTDDTKHWGQLTNQSQTLLHDLNDGVQVNWNFYIDLQ